MINEGVQGFPCHYTFKVFGHGSPGFGDAVRAVIGSTLGTVPRDSVKERPSAKGKYLCVSVLVHVQNRAQLDRVYADLHAHEDVVMCL